LARQVRFFEVWRLARAEPAQKSPVRGETAAAVKSAALPAGVISPEDVFFGQNIFKFAKKYTCDIIYLDRRPGLWLKIDASRRRNDPRKQLK
jgi:hypothetical protein